MVCRMSVALHSPTIFNPYFAVGELDFHLFDFSTTSSFDDDARPSVRFLFFKLLPENANAGE